MVSLDTINILTGICLVMLGRRLYWLFVGLLGFLYALLIVPQFLHGQPGWVVVAAALGAGTLGESWLCFSSVSSSVLRVSSPEGISPFRS